MIVTATVTVSANTSLALPQRSALTLPAGVLRHWWVGWRYGVADLAGLRVLYRESQALPWTIGEYLPAFDGVLEFPDELDVWESPRELIIETYNLDDTYAHTVWLAAYIDRDNTWLKLYQTIIEALRVQQYG